MKKIFLLLAICALASCEGWEPVFTGTYDAPKAFQPAPKPSGTDMTIAGLKALYTGQPVNINKDYILTGKVISSDQSGNVYRSLYIQDETGGIELKIGKSSLYADYHLGQTIYVKCNGLVLGDYKGMLQLGYKSSDSSYETAYMDSWYIINEHVLKGELSDAMEPLKLSGSDLSNSSYLGRYVEFSGCSCQAKVFAILYGKDGSSLYLSDGNYGIDSWAMTENGFKARMTENGKEEAQSAFEGQITKSNWANFYDNAAACSVSQYFSVGNSKTDLQVRTSGYAKFADTPIPTEVWNGTKKCTLRGILTKYNDNIQFVLIDLETGITIE